MHRGRQKGGAQVLVNFVPAVACHFCLNLPAKFSQPWDHFLAQPCTCGDILFKVLVFTFGGCGFLPSLGTGLGLPGLRLVLHIQITIPLKNQFPVFREGHLVRGADVAAYQLEILQHLFAAQETRVVVPLDQVLVDVVHGLLAKLAILVLRPQVLGGGSPVGEDLIAWFAVELAHA